MEHASPSTDAAPPRRLWLYGLVLALLAAGAVVYGVWVRHAHEARLESDTDAAAVPVVAVTRPEANAGGGALSLPGDVEAFQQAPLYARVNGYLRDWRRDIGARVGKGDILATIDTPDLDERFNQAKAELAVAEAKLALARTTAGRWHALLATNSVSQQSADEKAGDAQAQAAVVAAERAHVQGLAAQESFKQLTAPFDGVVTARNTDIGALIDRGANAGAPLFKVADLHEMRVYVRVPQAYAGELRPGLEAALRLPQYPGRVFPARLETTSNAVSLQSRTVLAELMAPNPDGKLWPGTYADVTFHLDGRPGILRVPTGSVVFREHGAQLAVVGADDRLAMKDVTLGRNAGTTIEVLSGIDARDRVVEHPPDTLRDGETVRVVDPHAKAETK